MKRLLVSLLALLYLAAGAGFTLREHYCMGQMIGASIEHTEQVAGTHRCDHCGMQKKSNDNGCCRDKIKVFKSSPDQVLAKALTFSAPFLVATLPCEPSFYKETAAPLTAAIPAAPVHGPPLRSGVPLYLRIRAIRI